MGVKIQVPGVQRSMGGNAMKAKDVPCKKCGGIPMIHGSDYRNEEGPWIVACHDCGAESLPWAYQREAWKQWRVDNKEATQ